MYISREMFMGREMFCVEYKGITLFNRDIRKAISHILEVVANN